MPVEAKPLFRPGVLRAHLAAFELPARIAEHREQLSRWADLLATGRANQFKEQELLADVPVPSRGDKTAIEVFIAGIRSWEMEHRTPPLGN